MAHNGAPSGEWAISGGTQLAGVLGWPVEHSVSPAMHNAAFRALGLDWCYLPFAVPPQALAAAVQGLVALGVRGVNVTIPHKQAMRALVDTLTPEAQVIGAVNTVLFDGAQLTGHNTDADGFVRALQEAGFDPRGCDALVLGAGGAARAVAYALARLEARVVIVNRSPERAEALARELGALLPTARLSADCLEPRTIARSAAAAQLVVNTTPLGMWPAVEGSPWPDDCAFPATALLFDLVYNPRATRLMAQARAAGATAVDGLRMLVHQGARALELWTGMSPPIEAMYCACVAQLGGE